MSRKKIKILFGLVILTGWILLFTGLIYVPVWGWIILALITLFFYLNVTELSYGRKKSSEKIFKDMEDYMEKKAEEKFSKKAEVSNEEKENKEEEYDFGEDIEIIKK